MTPPFLKFRFLTPPPLTMHNGAVFDYALRLFGCPLRWTSIISRYEPPHGFVDIQLRGPYAYWHHRHGFAAKDGGVEVTDEIHYQVGFSLLGALLHRILIRRQLNWIFNYRRDAVQRLFPAGGREDGTVA